MLAGEQQVAAAPEQERKDDRHAEQDGAPWPRTRSGVPEGDQHRPVDEVQHELRVTANRRRQLRESRRSLVGEPEEGEEDGDDGSDGRRLGARRERLVSVRMLIGMTTPATQDPMARIARRRAGTCQRSTGPNRARHQAITAAFSWNCVGSFILVAGPRLGHAQRCVVGRPVLRTHRPRVSRASRRQRAAVTRVNRQLARMLKHAKIEAHDPMLSIP